MRGDRRHVAVPALRLSGIYFALATAAFAITMGNWVFLLPSFSLFGHPYAPFGSGSLNFPPSAWVRSRSPPRRPSSSRGQSPL